MRIEVVPLTAEYFHKVPLPEGVDRRAYFSEGSIALCVLADGEPVFAGGIVNMQWNRGEAWIVPSPWYQTHFKTCFKIMRKFIPLMAKDKGFVRVQATCFKGVSGNFFRHLGFEYEARLAKFGPHGETCDVYTRIFEVVQ